MRRLSDMKPVEPRKRKKISRLFLGVSVLLVGAGALAVAALLAQRFLEPVVLGRGMDYYLTVTNIGDAGYLELRQAIQQMGKEPVPYLTMSRSFPPQYLFRS